MELGSFLRVLVGVGGRDPLSVDSLEYVSVVDIDESYLLLHADYTRPLFD